MNIWFVILVTVMTNGTVYSEIKVPQDLKYNNKENCFEVGQLIANMKQEEVGSNGKVVFTCNVLSETDIRNALTKKTDI